MSTQPFTLPTERATVKVHAWELRAFDRGRDVGRAEERQRCLAHCERMHEVAVEFGFSGFAALAQLMREGGHG